MENKKYLIVSLIIFIYLILTLSSSLQKSVTYDEITYLASGHRYLTTGDYTLNPEHPPLVKILAGFPLLFLDVQTPEEFYNQWDYGSQVLFNEGNDEEQLLFYARIPFIIIGILGAIYIFLFSELLFGIKSAFISLILYCFSPNILAHVRLAATDAPVAIFLLITMYYFYKYTLNQQKKNFIFSGVAYGLALSSKFTALYFLPVFFILSYLYQYYIQKKALMNFILSQKEIKKSIHAFMMIVILLCISFLILFVTYAFDMNAFLIGLEQVLLSSSQGRFSYLLGKHYIGNNILFYPIVFLTKTPLITLLLCLVSLLFLPRLKEYSQKIIFLIIPMIFIIVPSLFNKFNLGLRHILVLYPFLFIYLGIIFASKKKKEKHVKKSKRKNGLLQRLHNSFEHPYMNYVFIGLFLFYIISSTFVYPHYLTYFNEAVGGPSHGHKYLLDSNLDWGQDARALIKYLKQEQISNAKIAYFGTFDISSQYEFEKLSCKPQNGIIAISVNQLFGIRLSSAACYSWLLQFTPQHTIGNTIWIYNIEKDFSDQDIQTHLKFYQEQVSREKEMMDQTLESSCKDMCIENCNAQGKQYLKSAVNKGKCGCSCH